MNPLIEDYLRTRGVRYFRGHHEEEYFYLVDFHLGINRLRLDVHLEASGDDAVQVSITPDRYYPAQYRESLVGLVEGWNTASPALEAAILGSCDPRLIGVAAHGLCRPADAAALAAFVDAAVASSVELFAAVAGIAGHARQTPDVLRDAG
jgi:hypothetical protein